MKYINKFLIIFSFCFVISLLFIINVKANTTITFQSFPVIDAYMQETGKTIDDFRDIVMQNIHKPDDFDDYEHYVVLMEIGNNNSFTIHFWLSDRFNFAKNANLLYLRDGQYDIRHSKRYSSSNNAFTFNNDYTDISFNGTWNENTTYFMWFTNPLNYIILASDLDSIQYTTPTWQNDNFIIGSNTYALNDYIPLSDLNYYGLEITDYYESSHQEFGLYEDVDVITYKIMDSEVGNDKIVSLLLDINSSNIDISDITIYKYGSSVLTTKLSSSTCINGSNNNSICNIDIKYNVYDQVFDKLMFDFVLPNTYDVSISDNSLDNEIYINREGIDYQYKSVNFKELSAFVIYPRNYNLFNEIYNSRSDEFKFIISSFPVIRYNSNSDIVNRSVTYTQDFRYKNTYLYYDNSNVVINFSNDYTILNNLSFLKIPFVYDSSMLLDSHYPCFLLSNPNYLGTAFTNSNYKDVYLYYNSSLFDFKSTNHVYVNDDPDNNSTYFNFENISFDFIDSDNNYVSHLADSTHFYDSGYDDTIINKFNDLLEYFKDKITSFFELVSQFFVAMPIKFKNAFSLIFLLFVGIYLFRLLL